MEKNVKSPGSVAEPSGKTPEKEADTKQENGLPKTATTEEIPDPDEDDLDDLDDMLDEFNPSIPKPPAPTTTSSKPPPTTNVSQSEAPPDGLTDADFVTQLQAGMADLLGGLDSNPEMAAQFEKMLTELGGAGVLSEAAGVTESTSSSAPKDPAPKLGPSVPAAGTEESFQETIKKTMERMRASGDQATAAAASENTDDLLAEMMKAMQASGLDGEGGGEEEFSKMLLGMMEQLTNKEILYDPMKELHDKFPSWLEKNAGKVDEADLKRYKEQQIYVKEIVERFESKGYSDENAADREYIVERMQKMQAAGSPPPDLVGDMAAAQEAFGAPEEGCPTQ